MTLMKSNYTGLARKLNRKDAKSAKTKPFFESLCVLCVFAVSNWLHLNSYNEKTAENAESAKNYQKKS